MATPQRTASSTSRLRWLIPALGILAWIVVGSFTGPFAGKLASVSTNDNTAFLPASAESTRVNDELAKFQDTSYIPAIVVAERSSGFTDADATYLTDTITPLAGTEAVSYTHLTLPTIYSV